MVPEYAAHWAETLASRFHASKFLSGALLTLAFRFRASNFYRASGATPVSPIATAGSRRDGGSRDWDLKDKSFARLVRKWGRWMAWGAARQ